MKVVKFILGLVVALGLIAGGFMAGTLITQARTASVPVRQFAQPTFIPQQQYQPTVVPQAQIQPNIIPQQLQGTPVPQTIPPVIPPQGQWRPGVWMMGPQGEWEHDWMTNPNYSQQGQQGWGMMHNWEGNNWSGMHDSMMGGYGWQANPNSNSTPSAPNSSPSYATPSTSVSFKNDVQPIFATRCVVCHGGTNGLSLDIYDNVMKGGVNGAVIVPGDVYNSRLAYYVYSGYMPFRNTPLTSTQIQTILDWIALGAPNN